jgi:hypothetical protein
MIWAILLIVVAASPIVAGFALIAAVRAKAKPIIIIREDAGFGGDWK